MSTDTKYTTPGSWLQGFGAGLAALTTGLGSLGLFCFPGLYVHDLRCDESCGVRPGWTFDSSAWQWDLQFWGLAVPGVITGLLVVASLTFHRPRVAGVCLVACALSWLGYGLSFLTGGRTWFSLSETIAHPWIWLPYTVIVLGGATAVWIERLYLGPRTGRAK